MEAELPGQTAAELVVAGTSQQILVPGVRETYIFYYYALASALRLVPETNALVPDFDQYWGLREDGIVLCRCIVQGWHASCLVFHVLL
jgi:hypothetical protein